MTDLKSPFCAITGHLDITNGKKRTIIMDQCVKKKHTSDELFDVTVSLPYIEFNEEQFLKIYYDLFTYGDCMIWIEKHKYTPINTRKRIVNCALKVFGNQIEIIDKQFIDFFSEIIHEKFKSKLKKIYTNSDSLFNFISEYIKLSHSNNSIMSIDDMLLKFNKYVTKKNKLSLKIKS